MVATIDHALHRRQFVLDREPHKIHNAWVAVPLANGFTLSHCPELEVARALDADGRKWIMLGNAFDLDNEYRRAELSISRPPSQNIPCSTYTYSYSWATSEKNFTASTVIQATVLFGLLPCLATSSSVSPCDY